MAWLPAAAIGGGAALSFLGSRSAARAQERATQAAVDEQRRQYDTSRADLAPWRESGGAAVQRLRDLLGLGDNTGAPGYGDLNRRFTAADFEADPVTQLAMKYGLELGTKAIDRGAGAAGLRNSGATLKALTRFGQDYAGSKAGESYGRFYGDQDRLFNRLAGLSGTGQTATGTGVAAGQGTASNIGNLLSAGGNARGAAAIAGTNAISNAIGQGVNYYSQQQTLDRLLRARGPGGVDQGYFGGSGGY